MVNLLGEEGYTGKAVYEGLEKLLAIRGSSVFLYGKRITKPFRKMGHVTVLGNHLDDLARTVRFLNEAIQVKA